MRARRIATETFADRQANQVQAGISAVRQAVDKQPYTKSSASAKLTFAGGDTKAFAHGLGRTPDRWSLEDATGAAPTVYRVSWDDKRAVFKATSACTVVVRVGAD